MAAAPPSLVAAARIAQGAYRMPALGLAVIAAALAGFSRGYAAIGAAMIYIPLVTLAYDARTAVVTIFLVDLIPALPLIWKAAPRCDRRALAWMALGAVALTPIGVALLLIADATQMELVIGLMLMAAASSMLLRQNLRLRAAPLMSIGAGAVSGLAGGVCGIFGPPAMIYLLGRRVDARDARADTNVFLSGQGILLGLTYLLYGMYTRRDLELSLLLMPVYGLAMWYGATMFARTSEAAYRRAILALVWAMAAFFIARSVVAIAA